MEEAVKFFEDEIYQFDLQLKGILDDDYGEYLNRKRNYYEFAAFAIKEYLVSKEDYKEYYKILARYERD